MDLKTLHKITYGLYIVSSVKNNKLNGQITNTVFQLTSKPVLIGVCINKDNLTHEYINFSKIFTISILKQETSMNFIGKFGFRSGRDIDKFKDTKYKTLTSGAPFILENTLAGLECQVKDTFNAGSHTLFVGELTNAETFSSDPPLTYEYYHRVLKGKVPKTATTYLVEETHNKKIKKEEKMSRYVCSVCGYIYDPAKGDPDNNIQPGTSFEDLPEDWVCPVCGVGKDKFEKES